jgi:hypothetical protein
MNLLLNKSDKREEVHAFIDELVSQYKYKPLPKRLSHEVREYYESHLNGFDEKRIPTINGIQICSSYDRIVIGDYGAYLEFPFGSELVKFSIKKGQEWRFDDSYIMSHQLSIKYLWLDYYGVKVYLQTATVKYADYKPDFYYISVHDFDSI